MTHYRDDRFDDRYDRDDRYDDRDLTSDDRRFRDRDFGYGDRYGRSDRDDDRRGMMDRMRDLFGGRDGDDRRGERYLYANRSGMGRGMGGRDRDGDDRSDMGMGYGSMGYGQGRSRSSYTDSFDNRRLSGDRDMSYSRQTYGADPQGSMDRGMGRSESYRGKGPKGYQRSDDRIREMVNDALEDDDYVDASDIEVQVQGGEVTLTGTVRDRQQKRRAEEVIEHLRGVRDVHNHLRVSPGGMGQGAAAGPSGMVMSSLGQGSSQGEMGQTGSSQTSLGSAAGGTGMGSSTAGVDRTGDTGYTSGTDTPMGSLGSSVDSGRDDGNTRR
ncbi:hypothetical protein RDMS_10040 [Deinococcus sp. RL]|uniref:BON domain-containing protein n=1 Tax=Deinococcus sp. RL TaxID=1489678 RepID=UPI0004DAE34A|nr:BON domain-containing protein [Deinococcus sp. RL]KEF33885.1 hypothetical protein RDMS_10040 [Deinococcus sp. RL]